MEKSVTFQWKEALIKASVLGYPCFNGNYLLDTDTCNQAIGAVLSQMQDGEEKPLAYYCQTLSQQERQCSVTLLELLTSVSLLPLSLSLV